MNYVHHHNPTKRTPKTQNTEDTQQCPASESEARSQGARRPRRLPRTFGTNTRQRVMVLQKMMTRATMQNCTLGWSRVRKETAAPMMHMIPTLYTLIPMYLLSLRAGMLTLRVSHAKKQPNNCNREQKGEMLVTTWPHRLAALRSY